MLYTRLLDSFRSAASVSQTNIDIVTNKTKELIKRSGGWHWFLLRYRFPGSSFGCIDIPGDRNLRRPCLERLGMLLSQFVKGHAGFLVLLLTRASRSRNKEV